MSKYNRDILLIASALLIGAVLIFCLVSCSVPLPFFPAVDTKPISNTSPQAHEAATKTGNWITDAAGDILNALAYLQKSTAASTQPAPEDIKQAKTILAGAHDDLDQAAAENTATQSYIDSMEGERDALQFKLDYVTVAYQQLQVKDAAKDKQIEKDKAELKSQHITAMCVALALMIGAGIALMIVQRGISTLGIGLVAGGAGGLIIINFVHAANDWVDAHIGYIIGGIVVALGIAALAWWEKHKNNVNLKVANAVVDATNPLIAGTVKG